MPDIPAELEAVAGPLKGSSIPLSEDEVSLGREPSNGISLLDAAVSRRHCVITHNAGQFKIQDLNSRNSTFVNGVPVTERTLASGDEIKIGSSLFVFVLPETEAAKDVSTSVEFDKTDPGGGSTIVLRKQDARYLRDLIDIKASGRILADLNALLRISKAVNSVRGLEALEKQVLESIFEVAPADRAAILLCEHGAEEWTSVFGWDRRAGPSQALGGLLAVHRSRGAVDSSLALVVRVHRRLSRGASAAGRRGGGDRPDGGGRERDVSRSDLAACRRRPRAFPGERLERRPVQHHADHGDRLARRHAARRAYRGCEHAADRS